MNFLGAYDDDSDEGEGAGGAEGDKRVIARGLSSYTAPKNLMLPTEEDDDDGGAHEDQFGASRRIVDRESDYHRRRLNRNLSPPRADPFATNTKKGDGKGKGKGGHGAGAGAAGGEGRSYADSLNDARLERERFNTLRNIEEKRKREEEEARQPGRAADNFTGAAGPTSANAVAIGGESEAAGGRSRGGHGGRGGGRRERSRSPPNKQKEYTWGKAEDNAEDQKDPDQPPPESANFGLSGKLAEEANTVKGVQLVYTEPAEACVPKNKKWRLYVFKNGKPLGDGGDGSGVLHIHRQSMFLLGRERKVADIPTDHPSCSKQHAAIQFRQIEKDDPITGFPKKAVNPYLIDLGSTNGSFINGDRLEPQRYYQLLEGDTLKFGSSSREYVLLHDKSNAA